MSNDDLLVKISEEQGKISKKQRLEEAEISDLLAGIRTLLKSDEKN